MEKPQLVTNPMEVLALPTILPFHVRDVIMPISALRIALDILKKSVVPSQGMLFLALPISPLLPVGLTTASTATFVEPKLPVLRPKSVAPLRRVTPCALLITRPSNADETIAFIATNVALKRLDLRMQIAVPLRRPRHLALPTTNPLLVDPRLASIQTNVELMRRDLPRRIVARRPVLNLFALLNTTRCTVGPTTVNTAIYVLPRPPDGPKRIVASHQRLIAEESVSVMTMSFAAMRVAGFVYRTVELAQIPPAQIELNAETHTVSMARNVAPLVVEFAWILGNPARLLFVNSVETSSVRKEKLAAMRVAKRALHPVPPVRLRFALPVVADFAGRGWNAVTKAAEFVPAPESAVTRTNVSLVETPYVPKAFLAMVASAEFHPCKAPQRTRMSHSQQLKPRRVCLPWYQCSD